MEPGYAAIDRSGSVIWATITDPSRIARVKACPQNYYCPGGSVLSGGTGVPVACPNNLKTEREGARSASECGERA